MSILELCSGGPRKSKHTFYDFTGKRWMDGVALALEIIGGDGDDDGGV